MPKTPSVSASFSPRSTGRKIDTWKFRMEQVDRTRKPMEIEFEVALLPSMEFVISTDDISKERWQPLQGQVLADLRRQAHEAADAEFNLQLGLVWTDWLEVRVKQVSHYDMKKSTSGAGAQAHVSYSVIPRGENSAGQAYTISENSGVIVAFPDNVQALPPGTDSRRKQAEDPQTMAAMNEGQRLRFKLGNMDQREPHIQYTYLPDTPENRAGLDSIIQAINTVNLRLQQFLDPSEIGRTLARAASAGPSLLAGPSADPTARPSKGPGR